MGYPLLRYVDSHGSNSHVIENESNQCPELARKPELVQFASVSHVAGDMLLSNANLRYENVPHEISPRYQKLSERRTAFIHT